MAAAATIVSIVIASVVIISKRRGDSGCDTNGLKHWRRSHAAASDENRDKKPEADR
ncbi:hypothetical protein [Agrobacterium tumefaciens]|uniref:hypothetical protein n=1 Tax=Agrobacterium tumefaciens TaxID=358 RepID=UPI001F41D6D7|nr:hypothetical protein [Agrobacterium tumefaciens]